MLARLEGLDAHRRVKSVREGDDKGLDVTAEKVVHVSSHIDPQSGRYSPREPGTRVGDGYELDVPGHANGRQMRELRDVPETDHAQPQRGGP
jgi:hypothetical protein